MSTERWGGRGGHQKVYRYSEEEDRHRMGDCKWLPKHGDLCIRTRDSGDHFHDYTAIRQGEDKRWTKCGEFSAYQFGELVCKLHDRAYHLLMAGESVLLGPAKETKNQETL